VTSFVSDKLVSFFASTHVPHGQVDALLLAAPSNFGRLVLRVIILVVVLVLVVVVVKRALVNAAKVPRFVLPVSTIIAAVTNL
jgi:hypothetical protein